MKTDRTWPLPDASNELQLSEEVQVLRPTRKPRRMLIACALAAVPELIERNEAFEVQRMNGESLALFDGEELTGRTEIMISLSQIREYLTGYARMVAAFTGQELLRQMRARQESAEAPAKDQQEQAPQAPAQDDKSASPAEASSRPEAQEEPVKETSEVEDQPETDS